MAVRWCDDCRVHHFDGEACYPVFELSYPDWYGEDEWVDIRGCDMEEAVERWAEQTDCDGAEYTIVNGDDCPVVRVREHGSAEEKLFKVVGEAVPSYSATEAEWCRVPGCESKGDARVQFLTVHAVGEERVPACQACYRRFKHGEG